MIAVDSARRSIDETAESHFEVMLRVPIKYRLQLVFRQVRRDRIKADMPESFQFQFCDGIGQYAPWFGENPSDFRHARGGKGPSAKRFQ